MTNVRRWKHLLEAGEGLLLVRPDPDIDDAAGTAGVVKQARRLEQWIAETGMATSNVLSTPLVAAPLPLHARHLPAGRRGWEGLDPGLLWHPLLWLPERLARPYVIVEGDDDRLESVDEWAIRLALELTASGMYDPATGGWVDVLALHDLDITGPGQLSRLGAWLAGARDDELDAVDLAPYVTATEDPDWAVQVTAAIFEDVVAASWSLVASDLLAILHGMDGPDLDEHALGEVITLGQNLAGDAVIDLDLTLGERLAQIGEALEDMPTRSPMDLSDGPLAETVEAVSVAVAAYSPALANLEALSSAA